MQPQVPDGMKVIGTYMDFTRYPFPTCFRALWFLRTFLRSEGFMRSAWEYKGVWLPRVSAIAYHLAQATVYEV